MRWIFVIFLMLVASGCSEKESPMITLVIQDGFTGVVILRWQQPKGVRLEPSAYNYFLEVPPSGILEIQGPNLMLDWFVEKACYASGASLPKGDQHTKDEEGIYLWSMGLNADTTECWYVVGKIQDLNGVRERKMGIPPFRNPLQSTDATE